MTLRRIATAASTIAVAVVLALLVPVSQLPTVAPAAACCCPDPDRCKCPDHQKQDPTQSTMKKCGDTAPDVIATALPSFVTPSTELASDTRTVALLPRPMLNSPHPAPAPRRPDAPS